MNRGARNSKDFDEFTNRDCTGPGDQFVHAEHSHLWRDVATLCNNVNPFPWAGYHATGWRDTNSLQQTRWNVRDIIAEPLEVMELTNSREETDERVHEIAARCRLNLEHLCRFPHAFSGGQRQRISIARALVSTPRFVVTDESVAALDVSIQADILNLLKSLQKDLGLTYLFISHDLSVVAHICDHVAVMYLGRLVETASTRELFNAPRHPYTKALLSAIPSSDPDHRGQAQKLEGEIPSPTNPPLGCKFHTRFPFATDICKQEESRLESLGLAPDVACHRWEELMESDVQTAASD